MELDDITLEDWKKMTHREIVEVHRELDKMIERSRINYRQHWSLKVEDK